MEVTVISPSDYIGDIIGDLNKRRGAIQDQDILPTGGTITAMVPLKEMFGYTTNLRSMSQGRATFTMTFDHYEQAPRNIVEEVKGSE